MSYYIGNHAMGRQGEIVVDLNRFNAVLTAKINLIHAFEVEECFDILLGNYQEFNSEILTTALHHSVYARIEWHEFLSEKRTINRRISNLLSACRLYLDQLRHTIKSIYGEESKQLLEIQDYTSDAYDTSPSYRLMEAVRNFVQHRGLAAYSYDVNHQLTRDGGNGQIACTVTPQLSKQLFQSDAKFKASVKKELEALPEKIDIKPQMRSYMQSLIIIQKKVRALLASDLEKWEATFEQVFTDFVGDNKIASNDAPEVLAIYEISPESPMRVLQKHDIFRELITHSKELSVANTIWSDLSRHYATSQDVESLKMQQ